MSPKLRHSLSLSTLAFALAALAAPGAARADDDLVTGEGPGAAKAQDVDGRAPGAARVLDASFASTNDVAETKGLGIDPFAADALRAPAMDTAATRTVDVMGEAPRPPRDLDVVSEARTNLLGPAMDWLRRREKSVAAGALRLSKAGKNPLKKGPALGPLLRTEGSLPEFDPSVVSDLGLGLLEGESDTIGIGAHATWSQTWANFAPDRASMVVVAVTSGAASIRHTISDLEANGGHVTDGRTTVFLGGIAGTKAVGVTGTGADGSPIVAYAVPAGGSYVVVVFAAGLAADARHAPRLAAAVKLPKWVDGTDDAPIAKAVLEAAPLAPTAELEPSQVVDLGLVEHVTPSGAREYRTPPGASPLLVVVPQLLTAGAASEALGRIRPAPGTVPTVGQATVGGFPGMFLAAEIPGDEEGVNLHLTAYTANTPDGDAYFVRIFSDAAITPELGGRLAGAFVVRSEHRLLAQPTPPSILAAKASPGASGTPLGATGARASLGVSGGEDEGDVAGDTGPERGATPLPTYADNAYALGVSTGGLRLSVGRSVGAGVVSFQFDNGSLLTPVGSPDGSGTALGVHFGAISEAQGRWTGEASFGLHLGFASDPQTTNVGLGFGYRVAATYLVTGRFGVYGDVRGQLYPQESIDGSYAAVGLGFQYDGRP